MSLLAIRVGLAVAGLLLAVLAVARDDQRVTWVAIAVLAVALGFRLLAPRR